MLQTSVQQHFCIPDQHLEQQKHTQLRNVGDIYSVNLAFNLIAFGLHCNRSSK